MCEGSENHTSLGDAKLMYRNLFQMQKEEKRGTCILVQLNKFASQKRQTKQNKTKLDLVNRVCRALIAKKFVVV